jgi:hypothetical protein
MVHTGAKIQFGGLKNGLFKSGYQVCTDSLVTIDDTNHTNNGVSIETRNIINFFILKIIFFIV